MGIVTNRDLRFERDLDRPIAEVMTSEHLITVTNGTSLSEAEGILQQHKIEKLPVVDQDNNLVDSSLSAILLSTQPSLLPIKTLLAVCA